jgi:signal transduction histidine kinase
MNQSTVRPAHSWFAPRLKTKIYLGTVLLLALVIFVVTGGVTALNSMQTSCNELAEAGHFAAQINTVDRDIVAIRQHVLVFTFTANESSPDRVRQLGSVLNSEIASALLLAQDTEMRGHLEKMREHLGTYLKSFEDVIEERQLRSRLVQKNILEGPREITALLNRIVNRSPQDGRSDVNNELAEQILTYVSQAEISSLQFLSDPGPDQVNNVLLQLRHASQDLKGPESPVETTVNTDRNRLLKLLNDFEQGFLRTVQATRGYMYLANVVMAGEAAEFSYQSDRVKELSDQRLLAISQATSEKVRWATNAALLVSAFAILLAGTFSLGFARSVVGDISSITSTFLSLARGDAVEAVPGLNRTDEIGDMARAADVFRDKNQQTESLLSETQRMAKELDTRAEELAQSNRDLDSFAYVASHDLKSPLRAIDNISQWIAEDAYEVLPEESRDHFKMLQQRVKRMESLLDSLLAYSRAGRVSVKPVHCDTAELVREIQETIDWPAEMTLDVSPNMPTFESVQMPLRQVLQNLITNAVKYRRNDAPHLAISMIDRGDEFEFVVADNGLGIAPEFHDHIFQMFKRLHSQDEIEGSGMGLALVKKLVESYGGTIFVESVEGDGATFHFRWPKTTDSLKDMQLLTS